MPLHIIKKVSELVPEAGALIKRASLEQNLPTGSRDETLLSALELEYMVKFAHVKVDLDDAERVCKAVDLYGLSEEVRSHTSTMVKSASVISNRNNESKRQVSMAEDFISSQLARMSPDIEKVAEACEALWDNYSSIVLSDDVRRYAGAGTLVKEAAVLALGHRANRTGNKEFSKIASVISATDVSQLSVDDNRAILNAIKGLEKEAHYIESNIYMDMFITKAASVSISICNKSVDSADLVRIAESVGATLGSDIGDLLRDAPSNKDAIEALPMGEKQVIAGLL